MSIAIAQWAIGKADRFFAASTRLVITVLVASVAIIEQTRPKQGSRETWRSRSQAAATSSRGSGARRRMNFDVHCQRF